MKQKLNLLGKHLNRMALFLAFLSVNSSSRFIHYENELEENFIEQTNKIYRKKD